MRRLYKAWQGVHLGRLLRAMHVRNVANNRFSVSSPTQMAGHVGANTLNGQHGCLLVLLVYGK